MCSDVDGQWFKIDAQSPKRPCAVCTDSNSTLYVRYALEFECFGTGTLTSLGAPQADVNMSRLSADYDSSIGPNINVLQDVRWDGI